MTDNNARLPLTERAELFREKWMPEGVDARAFEAALLDLLISVRDEGRRTATPWGAQQ